MDHMKFVTILDGRHDLAEVLPGGLLAQPALVLHDVIVHVPPVPQLQHQVQLGLGVDNLEQQDYRLMFSCQPMVFCLSGAISTFL